MTARAPVVPAAERAVVALVPVSRRIPSTVAHMAGLALVLVSVGMLAAAVVEAIDGGDEVPALSASGLLTAVVGAVLWRGTRVPARVSTGEAFAAASSTWIAVGVAGTLPYVLSGAMPRFDAALFESVSGFTGTGSSVLFPIEGVSAGVLWWRQITQWYGGMGMIVLAVAVLPLLGVGGLELLRAESPGPTSDRIAPRVSDTAKRLYAIYLGLTVAVALALLAVGLSPFDATSHAFAAIATGGFSPYNASIAHFDSMAVEAVLIVAMVLGGMSFTLHWQVLRGRRLGAYRRSAEARFYLLLVLGATVVLAAINAGSDVGVTGSLRDSAFYAAAIVSTTGFTTVDYGAWAPAAQLVVLFLMVGGGMAGSTSGGVKLVRLQVMLHVAWRELRRARHPRAVLVVRLGRLAVPESIVGRIAGFVVLYVCIAVVGILVVTLLGGELVTSIGAVISVMSCVGPALGDAGPAANYEVFSRPAQQVLVLLMLFGRLEIVPVLLLLTTGLSRARGTTLPATAAGAPGADREVAVGDG